MAYAIVDPATGETFKNYPTATDAEVRAAVDAAEEAHRGWSRSSAVAERVAILREVARLHREQRDDLARTMQLEMGKRSTRDSAR